MRGKDEAWVPALSIIQLWRPVRKAARVGEQPGVGEKACVKRAPERATRSNAGVETAGSPYADALTQDWSSLMAKRTLGRLSSAVTATDGRSATTRIKLDARID